MTDLSPNPTHLQVRVERELFLVEQFNDSFPPLPAISAVRRGASFPSSDGVFLLACRTVSFASSHLRSLRRACMIGFGVHLTIRWRNSRILSLDCLGARDRDPHVALT